MRKDFEGDCQISGGMMIEMVRFYFILFLSDFRNRKSKFLYIKSEFLFFFYFILFLFSEFFNQIERNCFKIVHRKYILQESERKKGREERIGREINFFFFFRESSV